MGYSGVSWARFDDRYHDNRKVKRAWRRHPRAVGLHAMAVTYCAMHETDGVVDAEWLEEKLPSKSERDKVLNALTSVGLFEELEAGDFRVHDFLEYNHSREEADAQRQQKATRQQRWRERQRGASRGFVDRPPHTLGQGPPSLLRRRLRLRLGTRPRGCYRLPGGVCDPPWNRLIESPVVLQRD